MAALEVVHDIPGRLRLRLPPGASGDVVEDLRGRPGVSACTWSALTRSLLILYEAEATGAGALREAVASRLGVAVEAPPPEPDPVSHPTDPPAIATAVAAAVRELNAAVWRSTRGALDLRTLVPLALTGWALLEVTRGRVAPLAWSSALWYAHGLFRDYDLPPNP